MDTPLASHATPAAPRHAALATTTKVWLSDDLSTARVEWATEHGPATAVAKVETSYSRYTDRYSVESLSWPYAEPPDDIVELVREVVSEGCTHGCFADYESWNQMYDAVDGETTDRYAAWNAAMEAAHAAKRAVGSVR